MNDTVAVDVRGLRAAVAAAGGFERCAGRTTAKFLVHAIPGCLLYWACLELPAMPAALLTPVCAMVLIVAVMMGHEATHRAAYASRHANLFLRCFAFPLLSGLSGVFWHHKHNVLHHQHPNTVGRDQDLEVLPFAIGVTQHRNSSPLCQWIQRRIQRGWMFWLLSPLLPWDLRIRSLRHLAYRALRSGVTLEWLLDVSMIVAHVTVFIVLPIEVFGAQRALWVYLGVWAVAGGWLTLIGLVGHSACPLIDRSDDRWAQQFYASRDLRLNPLLSWCFVGLDYQIEHHLFPTVSQFRLRQIAPIVRSFAHARELPYRESGLVQCLIEITAYFDRAWLDESISLSTIPPPSRGHDAYP